MFNKNTQVTNSNLLGNPWCQKSDSNSNDNSMSPLRMHTAFQFLLFLKQYAKLHTFFVMSKTISLGAY